MLNRSFRCVTSLLIMLCGTLQSIESPAQIQGGNGLPAAPSPGNGRNAVTLYYALDFVGKTLPFRKGSFGTLGGDADTNITAIYLTPGYAVRVYDQVNLRKRSQTFTTSVNDLHRYNWNDRVASMTVFRAGQGGGRPPFG